MSILNKHEADDASQPWDRERREAYEREIAGWLKPVLPLMEAVDATFLDLHFGVTVRQLPPSDVARLFGLEPYSYMAKLTRLLYDADLLASEHVLEPPAAA